MNKQIVITYKNGICVKIDVPKDYYKTKYKNKSDEKLYKVFLKDYKKFIKYLCKEGDIVSIGKYLRFSDSFICGKDIMSVDLKDKPCVDTAHVILSDDTNNSFEISSEKINTMSIDLSDTQLSDLIKKVNDLGIVDNINTLLSKVNEFMDATMCGSDTKKKNSTQSKKKIDTVTINNEITVKDEVKA